MHYSTPLGRSIHHQLTSITRDLIDYASNDYHLFEDILYAFHAEDSRDGARFLGTNLVRNAVSNGALLDRKFSEEDRIHIGFDIINAVRNVIPALK